MRNEERHHLTERLVERARHLSAREQEEFLQRECCDDQELKSSVQHRLQSLISTDASHSMIDSRADRRPYSTEEPETELPSESANVEAPTVSPEREPATLPPDFRIGEASDGIQSGTVIANRYTLIEMIGEGGMGEVWVAEQTEPVQRRVALKLIKAGMDSKSVSARFEQERQALAMMDHPNIARVLDGGLTPNRQPFFVMEFVEGRPLTRYCDQAKLTLRERLELFVPICQAIQHAHQKGIVHRDLKPANILVAEANGRPLPKVIDFGVAKAIGGKLTEHTLDTQMGAVVGTLEYMSPEQAGYGKCDVDTRADIYTLGVILYELLTGRRPFDASEVSSAGMFEMVRMIVEDEPSRPSTRLTAEKTLAEVAARRNTEPRRLAAAIRGDLDWIVMKCLEKDRDRRYETANGLARDIERYLCDEPIEARPPSTGYRVRKFLQRNRTSATAAVLVLLALVGGVIGTSVGLFRESQARAAEAEQRRRAEDAAEKESIERRRAEDVALLMEEIFKGISPDLEDEYGVSFEEQMVAKLEEMTDALKTFSGDAIAQARLKSSFGYTLMSLSEFEQAQALLEDAVRIRTAELGEDHPDTEGTMIALGATYQQQGEFDKALELISRIRERVRSNPRESDRDLGDLDHMAGMIYQGSGQIEKAIELFEASRDRLEKDPDSLSPQDKWLVLHTLGASYREVGRLDESISLLQNVMAGRAELLGAEALDTLVTANSLAVAYNAAGQYQEAKELLEDVRDKLLKRHSPDHGLVLSATENLAVTIGKTGDHEIALSMIEESLELAKAKLGIDNPYTIRMQINLANEYQRANRIEEAEKLLVDVIQRTTDRYGENYDRVLLAKATLAQCLQRKGKSDEAIALLEAAVQGLRETHGSESPDTLEQMNRLASLYRETGHLEQAIELYQEVLSVRRTRFGLDHEGTLESMHGLGCCYFDLRRSAEAIQLFEEVLPKRRELLGGDDVNTLRTQESLAAAYWSSQQYDKSVPLLEDALSRREQLAGADDAATLFVVRNLLVNYLDAGQVDLFFEMARQRLPAVMKEAGPADGQVGFLTNAFLLECQKRNRFRDGRDVLEVLCEALKQMLGVDHPTTMQMVNNLGTAYWQGGQRDEAISLYRDLIGQSERVLGKEDPATNQRKGSLSRCLIDDGQYNEAIELLEEVLSAVSDDDGLIPANYEFMQRDLVTAYAHAGDQAKALEHADAFIEVSRKRYPAKSSALAGCLVNCGLALLMTDEHERAEQVIREGLEIREATMPNAWQTFSTRSMLGEALLKLQRIDEARPLLLDGYEGLARLENEVPVIGLERVEESIQRLIQLADAENDDESKRKWEEELSQLQQRISQRTRPSEK